MSELSFGKIIFGTLILGLIIGLVFYSTGKFSYTSYKSATLETTEIPEARVALDNSVETIQMEEGTEFEYKEGYVSLNVVYCGFSSTNEYAILLTDAVSNPQKIDVGKKVKISGELFELEEVNCDDESSKYLVLKKLYRLNRGERPS